MMLVLFIAVHSVGAQTATNTDTVRYFYPSGEISSEGVLRDGKPDGYWKTYHPNGALKSKGNRVNFELQGTWIFANDAGIITNEIEYKQGLKHGSYKTYEEGLLIRNEHYENDVKQGWSYTYYPEGPVKSETRFEDGYAQGNSKVFALDGRIITWMEYRRGVLVRKEEINRKDNQGRNSGVWKWWNDEKGYLEREGFYSKGLKNGYFKTYDNEGNLISVEKYVDDVLQENAIETTPLRVKRSLHSNGQIKTLGGFRNGVPDGVHRTYDSTGSVISGAVYTMGILAAEGVTDPSGKKQGDWKTYYSNGQVKSEGRYVDNLKDGIWKYYHQNGVIEQTGRYIRGLQEGEWRWYYDSEALRLSVYYYKGERDGESVEYDFDGNVIASGSYLEDMREGAWVFDYGDYRQEGKFVLDEQSGEWIGIYKDIDQVAFRGSYVDGLADGKHTWYYPSGKVKKEGKYIMGKEHENWIYYDEQGLISLYITFDYGKEVKYNGIKVDDLLGPEE